MQEGHRAINCFNPGLTVSKGIVEAGVLVKELELLDWAWEVLCTCSKAVSNVVRDGAFSPSTFVLGSVEDVVFCVIVSTLRLENELNNVLDGLDRREGSVGSGGFGLGGVGPGGIVSAASAAVAAIPCGDDGDDASSEITCMSTE